MSKRETTIETNKGEQVELGKIEAIEVSNEEILTDLMYPHRAYPIQSPIGVR